MIPDTFFMATNMDPDNTQRWSDPQGIVAVEMVVDQSPMTFSGTSARTFACHFV